MLEETEDQIIDIDEVIIIMIIIIITFIRWSGRWTASRRSPSPRRSQRPPSSTPPSPSSPPGAGYPSTGFSYCFSFTGWPYGFGASHIAKYRIIITMTECFLLSSVHLGLNLIKEDVNYCSKDVHHLPKCQRLHSLYEWPSAEPLIQCIFTKFISHYLRWNISLFMVNFVYRTQFQCIALPCHLITDSSTNSCCSDLNEVTLSNEDGYSLMILLALRIV